MITINPDGKFEEDQNIKLVDEMVSDNYNHRREPREKDRPVAEEENVLRSLSEVEDQILHSGSQARLFCGN